MSAMTGSRSPTSPWPQESQTLAHPGPSTPGSFFPLSDPRPSSLNKISPRGAAAELPDHNYFSFNVEGPSNLLKNRGHLSHALPNQSPEGKLVAGNDIAEQQPFSFGPASGSAAGYSKPAPYRHLSARSAGSEEASPGGTRSSFSQAAGTSASPLSTEHCAELVASYVDNLMLLDVRPFAHFSRGNIKGALNLCIPTTLLKRPSFDTNKLANTFTDEADRRSFERWRQCRYIIVYDSSTSNLKDAAPLANVLKKFTAEGWNGNGMILMGGFKAFSSKFPRLTQQPKVPGVPSNEQSSMNMDLPQSAPIAGGCDIPESSNAAIPFFSNIRQNMDLVGGVGQIALKQSDELSDSQRQSLPPWLREVSDPADQGRIAASRFFDIEKTELGRMKKALSYDNNDSSRNRPSSPKYRVAGIEKGTKNRYNDIYPYEHSRVKLQDIPRGFCDYVNASHLKAEYSDHHYIATQAPVPDTFDDFWRVIWEQDIRLVVSLTAEVERGQVKCHPYWKSGTYGPFYVNNFSKKYIPLEPSSPHQAGTGTDKSPSPDNPTLVVRHFGFTNRLFPLLKTRASKQLYGSQFDAGNITLNFGKEVPNITASLLASNSERSLVFIPFRDSGIIKVLQVKDGKVVPISQAKIPWDQSGSVQILKIAFDGHDGIYVLHRFTPYIGEHDLSKDHLFVKQARESGRDGFIYLTCHSLRAPDDAVRVTEIPNPGEFQPTALAVATNGSFAIAWCHRMLSDDAVVYYIPKDGSEDNISPQLVGFSHSARQLRRWNGNTRGPLIRDLAFNDRSTQLLYYYQAKSLYASYQKTSDFEAPCLYQNSTLVRFTDDLSLLFSIGIPFFGTHETLDFTGYSACRWSYLAPGIATHRKEHWTVACLLRSEATCQARNCGHILNLERGRRLTNWTVAARLWGFRDSTDSLGCRIATSTQGTRIAIANWNVVYVWALEPGALIGMDQEGYYHPSSRSPRTGQIELHPIVLHFNAVCFQLRFTEEENELIAVTDRGIMLWDLRQTARGARICQELAL
ncbi:hypothetical protein BDV18DRAFT_153377 [Aspergillus unguis]